MRLIDSDALLNEHCGKVLWGEYKSCTECYEDHEHKCYHEIDAQDIMDAPTIEAEPKRGICEDCLFLDSHDDFTFVCKKGKEIHDLNGTCDKWRSAYLRGEAEPTKHGRWIVCDDLYKTIDGRVFDGYRECSVCGEMYPYFPEHNYCPNCGCSMREDEVEE